jgi:hypothetical protein
MFYEINAQPTIFPKKFVSKMIGPPKDFSFDLYTYLIAKRQGVCIFRIETPVFPRKFGKSSWNSGLHSKIQLGHRIMKSAIQLKRNLKRK